MELLSRTCHTESANMERIFARSFVIVGGLFWMFMLFAAQTQAHYALLIYTVADVERGLLYQLLPLTLTIAIFIIGMYYERVAALILAVGAVAVVVWGIIAGWELGLWLWMGVLIIAPMVVAGLLYWLAARMEQICLMEDARGV